MPVDVDDEGKLVEGSPAGPNGAVSLESLDKNDNTRVYYRRDAENEVWQVSLKGRKQRAEYTPQDKNAAPTGPTPEELVGTRFNRTRAGVFMDETVLVKKIRDAGLLDSFVDGQRSVTPFSNFFVDICVGEGASGIGTGDSAYDEELVTLAIDVLRKGTAAEEAFDAISKMLSPMERFQSTEKAWGTPVSAKDSMNAIRDVVGTVLNRSDIRRTPSADEDEYVFESASSVSSDDYP